MSETNLVTSTTPAMAVPEVGGITLSPTEVGVVGSTIGPYRLLKIIGRGGMGEVWLAEQTQPLRRQVAVKIIKAGLDSAQVVTRFEAERQALALMDHPGIAKVFDAGATAAGRPYFAMEYVPGESLIVYCDQHQLTIPERLQLFIHLCAGVQHAHQKGVIHRDLKPSNVLVTVQDDRAAPKIIDFGIAKAMSEEQSDQTLHTSIGGFIGTLDYMSPEQAEPGVTGVDTRTDVYALGVILFQLMTGALPFDRHAWIAKGIDEFRRSLSEADPAKPSARVRDPQLDIVSAAHNRGTEPPRLANLLRGDLDWIILKALERDRARRYATVAELAADVRRHLTNEPVLASPPSTVYSIHKFVRRHRMAVSIASSVVITLVAYSVTMAVQARRIALERDRANNEAVRANMEAATANQVSEFLVGLFVASDPSEAQGQSLTARQILDRGADRIEQQLTNQPTVQARIQTTIGRVYSSLGLLGNAETLLVRAIATNRLLNLDSSDALTLLADVFWQQGRYADAEEMYRQLVSSHSESLGSQHQKTLRAQFDLASAFQAQQRYNDAERLYREVLATQTAVLGEEHSDTVDTINNLGGMYLSLNRPAEAQPLNARVLQLRRRDLGSNHPETLTAMNNLATTLLALKDLQGAEKLLVEAIPPTRRVLGELHPRTLRLMGNLGNVYLHQSRFADSEQQLRHAYDGLATTLGKEHDWTRLMADRLAELRRRRAETER